MVPPTKKKTEKKKTEEEAKKTEKKKTEEEAKKTEKKKTEEEAKKTEKKKTEKKEVVGGMAAKSPREIPAPGEILEILTAGSINTVLSGGYGLRFFDSV